MLPNLSPLPTLLMVCFHYSIFLFFLKRHENQYEASRVAMKARLENIQTAEAPT